MVNYTMKKLIVALLLACMVFTVLVAADETQFVEVYSRFDFGTKSKAVDAKKTSDADLRAILEDETTSVTNFEYIKIESTADTWIITALADTADVVTLGELLTAYNKTYTEGLEAYTVQVNQATRSTAMSIAFDDLYSDDFEDECVPGWGTYNGWPTQANGANYGKDAAWAERETAKTGTTVSSQWKGQHQYAKVRLKNNSSAKRFGWAFNNSASYATTMRTAFAISNEDTEFKTYIVNCVIFSDIFSGKTSHYGATTGMGNNWIWQGTKVLAGIRFWVFGPWCAYDAKLATSCSLYNWLSPSEIESTSFNEAEFGAPGTALRVEKLSAWYGAGCLQAIDADGNYTIPTLTSTTKDEAGNVIGYAKITYQTTKLTNGLDAAAQGKTGDVVEIDYIIFARDYEAASCYTSYLDDATETTGWLVWNEQIDEWLKANAYKLAD
jgi:hypothetical protein